MMAGLLNKVEEEFMREVDVYNKETEDEMKSCILGGTILIPLMTLVMVTYVRRLAQLCKVGSKCFLVLPKKLVYHISTAKHIRNGQVLETIGWISV